VRSRQTSAGLTIARQTGADVLKVTNRLGVPIEDAAIRGRDGNYYLAHDVPAGATADAALATRGEVAALVSQACAAHRPEYPPGLDRQKVSGLSGGRYGYWNYMLSAGAETLSDPVLASGRLEKSLAEIDARGNAAVLAPGSYVALVEQSPEVELGTPAAREEASFHVIQGVW
jgi:hypothetical protein